MRWVRLVIVWVGVIVLLAAGCTRQGAEKQEVVVNYGLTMKLSTLDPYETTDTLTKSVLAHIYEKLVEFDENMVPSPCLATKWEVSADGRTWTFELRKGVKFHDGTPFNAEAVKYSFEKILNPENQYQRRSIYEMIERIDVIDEYKVAFTTKEPFGAFLAQLANPSGVIVSPTASEKWGRQEFGSHPVGTGPFKFVEWKAGQDVIVERFSEYWGGETSNIDRIVFKPVPEDGTRAMMLETGELDVAYAVAPADAVRLKDKPNLALVRVPSTRLMYIMMNNAKPPFNDVRVRQALNYAVDKQAIVDRLLHGFGTVADSPIPPTVWPHVKAGVYEYNPEKAKQLLKEAGLEKGFKAKLWTPVGRYTMDAQVAEAVADYLRAVGVQVEFSTKEFATLVAEAKKPVNESQLEMALFAWGTESADSDYALRLVYHSSEWAPKGYNRFFYKNPEVDALLIEGMVNTDQAKRKEAYEKAQKLIWEDAPFIYLHTMDMSTVHNKRLQGVSVVPVEWVHLCKAKVVGEQR